MGNPLDQALTVTRQNAVGTSNTPIIQYWHAEKPPQRIAEGLASFRERNPGLPHLVFSHGEAEAFIAENLSEREASAFRTCGVRAMQADYFRYCAVLVLGGLYSDADFRCEVNLQPLIEKRTGGLFAREFLPKPLAETMNLPYWVGPYPDVDNSPLVFGDPGHLLLELVVAVATANIENRIADGAVGVWLTAGPGVLTCMYMLDRLGSIEAFRHYLSGTALEPACPLFCEIVGSHSTVARAMEGVSIQARANRKTWMRPLAQPQPGEQPYWGFHEGSIFKHT